MIASFKSLLYLICVLTDFSAFIVIFAVSRGLAEMGAETWYLGVAGAGLSLTAGIASILGGWLAHRFNGRVVFIAGAASIAASAGACRLLDLQSGWFLAAYWILGVGLGFLYPPLIGWLNRGEDAHANRTGVSRTLILFCVAWNTGMLCGQLSAGSLFAWGGYWIYGLAFGVACVNVALAVFAARHTRRTHVVSTDATAPPDGAVEVAAAFKRLSWIANLGGMFGGAMILHLLPDLAVTIEVPADDHGVLLACWRGVVITTYLFMHNAVFWHYRFATSLVSQLVGAGGLVIIACADSAPMLLVGLALTGQLVGYNYFSGLFYSTAGSEHDRRALAAGIHEATLAIGMAIGTIAGGVLGSWINHRLPYALAAAVIGALLCLQGAAWWRWVAPLRRPRGMARGERELQL